MRNQRPVQRGFTLVELMVVVAIIGILASVALPSFQRYTLRAKASERVFILKEINQTVRDFYMNNGGFLRPTGGSSSLSCSYNPPFPVGTTKRPWQRRTWDDWAAIGMVVEGSLYYTYYVYATANAGLTYYYPLVYGDVDGDQRYYYAYQYYLLSNDTWLPWGAYPPAGSPAADYF